MIDKSNIYYWKSDCPSVIDQIASQLDAEEINGIAERLKQLLILRNKTEDIQVDPAGGQGIHQTFLARIDGAKYFIRVDNGVDADHNMDLELAIHSSVDTTNVLTPRIFAVDTSLSEVPFSYQIMEFIHYSDLNEHYKAGKLDLHNVAFDIGKCIAKYQAIQPEGFGLFRNIQGDKKGLEGFHDSYKDYFFLNWTTHLEILVEHRFLDQSLKNEIETLVLENVDALLLKQGVLVHKDLALWNILGTPSEIKSIIDWEDAISGDPTDDISLMACFFSGDVIQQILRGYEFVAQLPENFKTRFWLHLLRNMIMKAVIRVKGGYFERNDDFFLIDKGHSGISLKEFTLARIHTACAGLKNQININSL